MCQIRPVYFGSIESISVRFAAFENWPDTRIVPFSKEDISQALKENRVDDRSFQSEAVQNELNILLERLNKSNTEKKEKDSILREWARDYHIKRTAYLVNNFPSDPIRLKQDLSIIDGAHRIMAAIVMGKSEIGYVIIK